MYTYLKRTTRYALLSLTLFSCEPKPAHKNEPLFSENISPATAAGKLFIIGGGKRPAEMIRELIDLSQMEDEGRYAVILPMASEEPDSAVFYGKKQFQDLGIPGSRLKGFPFTRELQPQSWIDSLSGAHLIYISGGDQNRFMEVVKDSPIHQAIRDAYSAGAVIAGTSAGAAVMSKKMITGNEFKHPEYTGEYRSIEAENIEIGEGLGLVSGLIIDQHFIKRMRMNRLLSVALENPGELAVGIDESTALVVQGDALRTTGSSQVITIRYEGSKADTLNGLLGGKGLKIDVLLPGQTLTR